MAVEPTIITDPEKRSYKSQLDGSGLRADIRRDDRRLRRSDRHDADGIMVIIRKSQLLVDRRLRPGNHMARVICLPGTYSCIIRDLSSALIPLLIISFAMLRSFPDTCRRPKAHTYPNSKLHCLYYINKEGESKCTLAAKYKYSFAISGKEEANLLSPFL